MRSVNTPKKRGAEVTEKKSLPDFAEWEIDIVTLQKYFHVYGKNEELGKWWFGREREKPK